jgi:thioredoxin
MGMTQHYESVEPRREEVDALAGPTLLEFGSPWCGYCRMAQPLIGQALGEHARVRHIKIADGSGRRLGRSYKVKLWPTLIFLKDGVEAARAVRPGDAREIRDGLEKIDPEARASPAGSAAGT